MSETIEDLESEILLLMSELGYSREAAEAHAKAGYTLDDIFTDYMIPRPMNEVSSCDYCWSMTHTVNGCCGKCGTPKCE